MTTNRRRNVIGGLLVALVVSLGVGQTTRGNPESVQGPSSVEAPMFEVDPLWPKPLPSHWVIGSTVGVSVDTLDHVWIVHRPGTLNRRTEIGAAEEPPSGECCLPAPPVLEFDPRGTLVGHWGGPGEGYEWPESNHGITVDHKGNVWIGGNGPKDAQVLKFTRAGKFLMQFGHQGQGGGSSDTANFGGVAKIFVDPRTNEAYLADGYRNKRVAVIDADTGGFKRSWGAYGDIPDDRKFGPYDPNGPPAPQFRNPVHCAEVSNDGLVYVCDRQNDRIQVFHADGTFVKERVIAKTTLGDGSVWDIAFSRDPQQQYMYVADGKNERVYVVKRDSLQVLTSFGDGGRQPGQFFGVHSIATDSKGNIYTTETYEGKRVQRFVYRGVRRVNKEHQGTVWPASATR